MKPLQRVNIWVQDVFNTILSLWAKSWLKWTLWFASVVWSWWTIHHLNTQPRSETVAPEHYSQPHILTVSVQGKLQWLWMRSFSPSTFPDGLEVLWKTPPLIKGAHVGKGKHFTAASLSWAELPDFCWSSAKGQRELLLGDISGIPGQAWYVLSPRPSIPPRVCCTLAYDADTTICAASRWLVGKRGCTSSPPLIWAFSPGAEGGGGWLWCGEGCSLVFQRATP